MSSIQKIRFNDEANMYAFIFRFCLRYKGRKLVIAEDDIIRSEFMMYLFARRAIAAENKDVYGFCVYKYAPSQIDDETYSCLAEICSISGDSLETMTDIPYVSTVLDLGFTDSDDYWNRENTETGPVDYPRTQCFLMNSELKPLFLNTFAIAEKEIDLICPWINRHVVNEMFISLLQQAVSRGVKIKISYGIGTDTGEGRQKTTEQTVEMLKRRFPSTDLLKFSRGNTHIKYLICDDKYMMCGSYNFLSFTADYSDADEQRDEGMEYIVDKNQIAVRRRQLFFWD